MESKISAGQHVAIEGGKLHYAWSGNGETVLLLLHGNTVSSQMFAPILPLYQNVFRVLCMDFLGHGKSDRLGEFPVDLWHHQAMQAAQLLDTLGLQGVNVIGTSGGALVALNLALERPELVRSVIADSFEGETALDAVALAIEAERAQSKSDPATVRFWRECHGDDWESVVDNDTRAIIRHHAAVQAFFNKDLSELAMPVLLTASLQDEFAELAQFSATYAGMLAKIPMGAMHLFPTGGHPALLSNGTAFAALAESFFHKTKEHHD
ncbi:MAG: alpha/beta fold hydrolase [Deltaproteobacteria bacterium]|jgi:pimeloyl-ACP methyl ester carboxylesterase|nr:alpha/beta fold hydrolase [Deltaproteobacteria bacterium]